MLRFLLIAVPTFILGSLFGAFMWWAFSPLLIDTVADDKIVSSQTDRIIGVGEFKDADRAHKGAGKAQLIEKSDGSFEIQLSEFEVTNGPDLVLYVSSASSIEKSTDVTDSTWTNLGKLKGNKGDQIYNLPLDAKVEDVKSVVVWCEAFSVLFSAAPLN